MNATKDITSTGSINPPGYGPERTWKARIDLRFAARPEKTVLKDITFEGPLRIQRPFYPEKEPCHCYLLHPPGGLVSGDRLSIRTAVDPGAHALLTTPSAGKVYGTDSHNVPQGQDVQLAVQDGVCEWLPMETIVFDRANAVLNTSIDLSGSAECIGWDILCLGRPEGGYPFVSGRVVQTLSIERDGIPLVHERLDIAGDSDLLTSPFGLGGCTVSGTMYLIGQGQSAEDLVDAVRGEIGQAEKGMLAVTARLGVLLVRYLGDSAEECRGVFEQVWGVVRPELLGRGACPPRIWFT